MATPISSGRISGMGVSRGGDSSGLACQYFIGGDGSTRFCGGPGNVRPLTGGCTVSLGVCGGVILLLLVEEVVEVEGACLCVFAVVVAAVVAVVVVGNKL